MMNLVSSCESFASKVSGAGKASMNPGLKLMRNSMNPGLELMRNSDPVYPKIREVEAIYWATFRS